MPAIKNRKAHELYLTRTYNAPAKAVWDAWNDPERVKQWWGPRGFTLTHHSKNLRPGGYWKYTMHGPDGKDWPNKTIYHEVEPMKKLVYDHGGNDDAPPLFLVTVLFTEADGKTTLDFTMTFPETETARNTAKFIKQAMGDSTWDRLAEYLEKDSSGKEKFVINRTFHCSPATMREMWVSPEHFARWLPPSGAEMEILSGEIKEGSFLRWKMTGAHGEMFGCIDYKRIGADQLIYTQQFLDAKGAVSRHPMVPTWPETMLTTVQIIREDEDHTRVCVIWEPYGRAAKEELEAFLAMRGSMTQGWTGSFDKLEKLVEAP